MTASITRPRMATLDEIPVVDLAPFIQGKAVAQTVERVRSSCLHSAFFLVSSHGVSTDTIDRAFDAARRFFEQPLPERQRVLMNEFRQGYVPVGTTRHPGKLRALKEGFDFSIDLPLTDPDVRAGLPMHGPNQWPALAGFREPLEMYFAAVRALGDRLLQIIALSLDLEQGYFLNAFGKPIVSTRLVHYPVPEECTDEDFGIGADPHTDFGMLTILAPDPDGGLEVQLPSGEWVEVPNIPGTFVINLGDLMARWTNDLYRSNMHRVVNRLGRARYSIPTFFTPSYRTIVECLTTCLTNDVPARYAPILAGSYVTQRLQTNQGYRPRQTI